MSSKKKSKKPETVKRQSNLLPKIIVIVVGVVLIFTVLDVAGYIYLPHGSSNNAPAFTAPSSIPWGTFTEISNKNFAGPGAENIYFISWIGCPIGASISWSLNYTFSHYQGVTNVKTTAHLSDPDESDGLASLPGLLFDDSFSYKSNGVKISFYPVYMYNETLFGYASNDTPIPQNNLVRAGLSVVNSSVPSGIASLVYKYTNTININNPSLPHAPSAFLSTPHHMNTVLVITGSFGTYMLNGQLYPPTNINGSTDSALENAQANGYPGYTYIAQGAETINSIINK